MEREEHAKIYQEWLVDYHKAGLRDCYLLYDYLNVVEKVKRDYDGLFQNEFFYDTFSYLIHARLEEIKNLKVIQSEERMQQADEEFRKRVLG